MASSFSFDHGPSQNDFLDPFDQILQEFTSVFAKSPEKLIQPLPDSDSPSFLQAQPSTVYPPAHEARYPAGFVAGLSNPMAHTSFDHHDRPPQPNLQWIPYLRPFFNPLDPGPPPTAAPTTQHSYATLGAGRPLVHGDSREYSSSVASGSSPIHDFSQESQHPLTYGQPRYNGSHMLVSQHEPSHSAMRIPHPQMQPAPASVVQSSSSIPSDLALQPPPTRHPIRTSSFPIQSVSPKEMISPTLQWVRDDSIRAPSSRRNSRRSNSVISPPYCPTRTSSVPVQPTSPKEMALHICQWVGDDGTPCRGQITREDLSQHLAIHGVKGKASDHRLSCRWLGCRLKGDKHTIKRESILRHVLEVHTGYRRVSK